MVFHFSGKDVMLRKNKTFLSKPLALSFIRCYNAIMIYSA